ncbi:MAG: class I adenylate-forming enzyme family protein [Kribbellaceae bacterium]
MNANFADLVRATARRYADRPALVDGVRLLTWQQLDEAVDAAARGFAAAGLVPGYRVVLLMANSVDFVTSYLGCLRAGLVAVPLNTGLTAPEIAGVLQDSGARLVVADGALAGKVADEDVRVVRPGELTGDALLADAADPEALALLLYTSGTSGEPRAAMLTHRALLANVEHLTRLADRDADAAMNADDVVLGVLPLFHVFGLNAVLGWVCATGASLVLTQRFDSEGTLALVREHGITRLPLAPPAIVAWLGRDDLSTALKTVRMVLTGASALDPAVAARFRELTGLHVHQGYGLTEAAPGVTTTLGGGEPAPGSVGRPLPGVELRIVDEQGDDTDGRGDDQDPGEILVRGANLFSGYWPDGTGGPDDDGWYPTGDVGYLDGDGQLYLIDRKRELVIVSGFNVFPVEVEEVLVGAPGVREAAVIGVPAPDTGEAVKAFVVPRTGEQIDVEAVRSYAGSRLAPFKCPVEIEVVDQLPHSVTGKVAKGRLRGADR